jgi:CheY-like chemotaxis protein
VFLESPGARNLDATEPAGANRPLQAASLQAKTTVSIDRLSESKAQLAGGVPHDLETIETTLRHSPTATANDPICSHDFDGRILSVNGTACEALGVPAAALGRMTSQEPSAEGRASGFDAHIQTPPSSDMDAVTGPGPIPAARKLLMIEDEQAIVEGITALLELDGIEVQAIGNGNETTEALARFHPDVVLLDYGLPGMDGSQVYAQIRALDPLLPVIFASGQGDRRLQDGIEDPLTRFLQKPFDVADLLEILVDLEAGGSG